MSFELNVGEWTRYHIAGRLQGNLYIRCLSGADVDVLSLWQIPVVVYPDLVAAGRQVNRLFTFADSLAVYENVGLLWLDVNFSICLFLQKTVPMLGQRRTK